MKFNAYAKINLGLKIVGVDPIDHYHYLDMVTLPIELHDEVEIDIIKGDNDVLTCSEPSIPTNESNTVIKSIKKMREKYGFKERFLVHINKVIPQCAGLGGGSADAAAVIKGINEILNLNLTIKELCEIGIKVGSDVPLCIMNKPCHIEGKGEIVNEIKVKDGYYALLCKPSSGLSTKEVYEKYDSCNEKIDYDISLLIKGLEINDEELVKNNIGNDLEKPAREINKDVDAVINKLKQTDSEHVFMTGSGACVIALSKDQNKLLKIKKIMGDKLYLSITKTI